MEFQKKLLKKIAQIKYFRVEILAYCLMPTHFHFLIKQKKHNGISKFMADIVNSFTRYFNLRNERKGPLFLPRFKSVLVATDNQLMHVSRYIHLNPYSSGLIKNINSLNDYQWSSFGEYLLHEQKLCNTKLVLSLFRGKENSYKKFIEDNADYQRSLEKLKYLKTL
ncbi:transposase [Candidatus Roizmanbacteria bacterium]|nr:transposase [Candidatus Roizmanbacteria bacterium]